MDASMQMMDMISNNRAKFEPQTRANKQRIDNRGGSDFDRSEFKSVMDRINQQKRQTKKAQSDKAEQKDLEKLASQIRDELKSLTEGDSEALEELLALLAEFEFLLEDLLTEELLADENLDQLVSLLEELDVDLSALEEGELSKEELVTELLNDDELLAKLNGLDPQKLRDLLADEKKDMLKLQQLLKELKAAKEKEDLSLADDKKTQEKLAEIKELLADLNGKFSDLDNNLETDFKQSLSQMEQQHLLLKNLKQDKKADDKPGFLDEDNQFRLLDELTADEIKNLLSQENDLTEKSEGQLFELELADAGFNLIKTEESLAQLKEVDRTDFDQFMFTKSTIEQIGEELELLNLKKGKNEISLQLEPKALGKLDININLQDGEMIAKIVTETSEVRDLLNNNLDLLKSMLVQKDMDVNNLDFSVMTAEQGFFEDASGGEAGSNSQFLFEEQEQQQPEFELEFDLDRLTKIDIQHSDPMLTSKDVDYVI